jgi:hypothetical protein
MVKRIVFSLCVLLLGGILLLRAQPLTLAAPDLHTSTPTLAPEEESAADEPTLQDLLARIEALEAQIAALSVQTAPTAQAPLTVQAPLPMQVNQVTTAIYLLDNAGLHDLDVRLTEEGVIQPYDSGRVARIARLLSTVDWPHDMAADAETLTGILADLSAALADDDLETAAPLAVDAHDLGHDLSHAAEHWLGDGSAVHGAHSAPGQIFRVTTAVYLLDNAGLHDLDVRLNEEGVIQPYDSGRVARIARLLSTVDWPDAMADDAEALISILTDLSSALADDDLESAAPLAVDAHELGHDLSHAAEHWLGEMSDAPGDHAGDAAHDDDQGYDYDNDDQDSDDDDSEG